MNERQLRYACGVWHERSFSRAAERLHVSQPSLSDQVRLLEEEIGFPIFYRSARGIEPSVNGVAFLERAAEVLGTLSRLETLGRRLKGREQEVFRIGLNTGIADRFLIDISKVVAARSDGFRLEIATSTNRRIQRLIHQGKLDAGFLLNADLSGWADKIRTIAVLESEIVLALPPGFALPQTSSGLDFAALAKLPLIVSETELGLGRAVLAAFRKAGVEPNIVADCDNVSSVKTMVMSGFGVALLPTDCISDELNARRMIAISLASPIYIPVQLVEGLRRLLPALQECVASLQQYLSSLAAAPRR